MSLFKLIAFVIAPLLVASYVFWFMSGAQGPLPEMVDGWWGRGPRPSKSEEDKEEAKAPVKFTITTSNVTLIDLRVRLHNARLLESLDGTGFEYGMRSDFLRGVLSHWKDGYNWGQQEAKLNSLHQFKTKIEGIEIHFVRVNSGKKQDPKGNRKSRAILLIHGWPGSFWEFYKVIPLLTEAEKEGKKAEETQDGIDFEIICPSIPGYGFSEAPHKPGFDGTDAARVFFKLMKKLGHDKFYVHGGDWGGAISTIMAQAYPQNVLGVHVNFAPPSFKSLKMVLMQFVGEVWPSLIYNPVEMEIRVPMKQIYTTLLKESGYMHIQATKPDTVGFGLNDSPAGLAAYILEKFSTWTNPANRECADGCMLKYFTLDELLTNVMIYWLSGNVASSMRFYKEFFISPEVKEWEDIPVLVPSGVAAFPHELIPHVSSIVSVKFRQIVQYTNMPRGGHFAAMEEPKLLADDIREFVKTVEKLPATSQQ